ncbi:hypothetical protein ACFX5Q_11945, partial [Mesorhizobium sp. IMUNJ 23033]
VNIHILEILRLAMATSIGARLQRKAARTDVSVASHHSFRRCYGTGFDGSASSKTGLGLRNMQERMAHFRGLLLLDSLPTGTTLTAMLPKSANMPASERAVAA